VKEKQVLSIVLGVVGGIVAIIFLGIIMVALSSSLEETPREIWYSEMTMGDQDAKNHFIIYSDIACPYCIAFENAMIEHQEDLDKYIAANDALIEVRASDFLYEYGESRSIESRYSAIATYCALHEGKFWDYYDKAITTVWNDYFADQGKSAFTEFNKNGKDYWINMGKSVGLGETFETCVRNDETLAEVEEVSAKMARYVNGLPYYKFNKWVSSGFDLSWGWDYVLMYFDAGLKN
jgi:hypothetical protein